MIIKYLGGNKKTLCREVTFGAALIENRGLYRSL